jgi:HlyD family secretion protein
VSELHNFRVEATVSDFYARYLEPGLRVRVGHSGQALPGACRPSAGDQGRHGDAGGHARQPDHPLLRNRLRVDAYVVTAQKGEALVADAGPAFNGKGRQDVFVSRAARAQAPLDVGLGDGSAVEIIAGAKAGEQLIVSDTSRFKHLDSIRISD